MRPVHHRLLEQHWIVQHFVAVRAADSGCAGLSGSCSRLVACRRVRTKAAGVRPILISFPRSCLWVARSGAFRLGLSLLPFLGSPHCLGDLRSGLIKRVL